jgi:hypothetical protein
LVLLALLCDGGLLFGLIAVAAHFHTARCVDDSRASQIHGKIAHYLDVSTVAFFRLDIKFKTSTYVLVLKSLITKNTVCISQVNLWVPPVLLETSRRSFTTYPLDWPWEKFHLLLGKTLKSITFCFNANDCLLHLKHPYSKKITTLPFLTGLSSGVHPL